MTTPAAGPAAIVVMTKAPRPGLVKTRLCPPLTPEAAAAVHRAFLQDTLDGVRALAEVTLAVAYAPAADGALMAAACGGAMLVPQPDGDLGVRLHATFETLCARGCRAVVAIGADTPTLPARLMREALARLARPDVDVVLGPARDGGYYLIGLRAPAPALFAEIPWSTDRVYAETCARAAAARLAASALPAWSDVDTYDDLLRLAAELAADGAGAPHTRGALLRLGLL